MTIRCDKTNSRCVWKVLGYLLVVLLLYGLLDPTFFYWTPLFYPFKNASGAIRDFFRPPQWETLIWAALPDNSVVEYRYRRLGSRATEFSFRWQPPQAALFGGIHDYYMGRWTDGGAPRHLELRATKDYQKIWLIWTFEVEGMDAGPGPPNVPHATFENGYLPGPVKAALDTETGRFVNRFLEIIDPSLPRHRQRPGVKIIDPSDWPVWATPDGGILLAERDRW